MNLQSGDFEAIRKAIDSSLDNTLLSDTAIQNPVFYSAAEADLLALDADALDEDPTTATGARVRRALIYFIAARIAPTVPEVTGIQIGDTRFTRAAPGYAERAKQLAALAAAEVAAYQETSGVASGSGFFTRAPGYRGR